MLPCWQRCWWYGVTKMANLNLEMVIVLSPNILHRKMPGLRYTAIHFAMHGMCCVYMKIYGNVYFQCACMQHQHWIVTEMEKKLCWHNGNLLFMAWAFFFLPLRRQSVKQILYSWLALVFFSLHAYFPFDAECGSMQELLRIYISIFLCRFLWKSTLSQDKLFLCGCSFFSLSISRKNISSFDPK